MILFQLSLGLTRDIFFPLDLSPGSGEYIFHGSSLVLGKLFIQITVGEKPLLKAETAVQTLQSRMDTFSWLKRAM